MLGFELEHALLNWNRFVDNEVIDLHDNIAFLSILPDLLDCRQLLWNQYASSDWELILKLTWQ